MAGDILVVTNGESLRVENRGTANNSTVHGTALHSQESSGLKCQ